MSGCSCETGLAFGGLPSRLSFLEGPFSRLLLDSSMSRELYFLTGLSEAGFSDTNLSLASHAYFSGALSHLSTSEWCFLMAGLLGSCRHQSSQHKRLQSLASSKVSTLSGSKLNQLRQARKDRSRIMVALKPDNPRAKFLPEADSIALEQARLHFSDS